MATRSLCALQPAKLITFAVVILAPMSRSILSSAAEGQLRLDGGDRVLRYVDVAGADVRLQGGVEDALLVDLATQHHVYDGQLH
ncbi:hypothetical protein ACGFZQ_34375 [Streptomyces sp. NPDC048254]|uniref:hypothetical protein n=1 Tax=Streptomyces sp. NPDC048254 TaxID=3365525 RepID=UPI00371CB498